MQRRTVYGGGIALAGLVTAAVQVVQGLQNQETTRPVVYLFETVPFVLIALTLVYAGYWLSGQAALESDLPRVVAWGVGGVILFAAIAALLLFGQQVELGTLDRAANVAVDNVTVGAVVGVLVGLYDASNRRQQRALERERDRVETFANRAADVNAYGRTLHEATSLAEVSALCIQAIGTLLGVTDVAVVRTDGERVRVVENTMVGVDDATIAAVTERGLAAEVAEVVRLSDVPGADTAATGVVVRLSEGAESVVVAALTDTLSPEERDRELLELLLSHAATAVRDLPAPEEPLDTGG